MNMPAEMSFSSSSNDTTMEPDPSTTALTNYQTDVADWNVSNFLLQLNFHKNIEKFIIYQNPGLDNFFFILQNNLIIT